MQYINPLNLPPAMVVGLVYDEYNPGLGEYTPSSLSKPPYMKKLEELYASRLVKDVSDNFFLMLGSMAHKMLETSDAYSVETKEINGTKFIKKITRTIDGNLNNKNRTLREVRVYCKIGNYLIGAQFDNLWIERGLLQDYKVTSVYKFKRDYDGNYPDAEDWVYQLNIMAYILNHDPLVEKDGKLVPLKEVYDIDLPEINELEIVGMLRDFSKKKAKRESGYPKHPIQTRAIELISEQAVIDYVNSRGATHEAAKHLPLSVIPPCTDKEVWAKPTIFAVMKTPTAKRSSKNASSLQEAIDWAANKAGYEKSIVVERPGERTRCEGYCDVSDYCPHYENFLKNQ